ncbi:MAG: hypothetical protein JSV60_06330 [Desulfobacterales bacterium]|jgi:hypothetical protein|nr:MAG: hypothetical protein JSV60_06330 [Desulfobacterales bacterium]
MNKIVILTSQTKPDNFLITLLNMVFPDCEVHVVYSINEAPQEVVLGPSAKHRLTSQKRK